MHELDEVKGQLANALRLLRAKDVLLAKAERLLRAKDAQLTEFRTLLENSILLPIRPADLQALLNGLATGHFDAELRELAHQSVAQVAALIHEQMDSCGSAWRAVRHQLPPRGRHARRPACGFRRD